MDFEIKTNPSEILEAVRLEEAYRLKGHLKIFLGMAPGSGTTYAMLEEAQVLKKERINVVIGIINTHGCKDTELLLKDFASIPPITLIDHGVKKELDVDAVIKAYPSLVLIDDLAHSNAFGSKHAKRWQDVQEILDQGINVYTTLNVQNIESLKDIVENITEVVVEDTVPDKIVERATAVQLVDLTPDELIERVRDGKVEVEDQLEEVVSNFYQKEKLTALREIALRYVADKIDVDLKRMTPTKEGKIEWKTRDKFLVAINHSSQMQRLIRTARRLAIKANAPWLAVYVKTGKTLDKADSE